MKLSEKDVQDAVNEIFVSVFEIAPDRLHAGLKLYEDLGLDSIDAIDLAIAIERRFDVKVEQDLIKSIGTVQDVYAAAFLHQGSARSVERSGSEDASGLAGTPVSSGSLPEPTH
jgi:acyl carrier protein